MSEGLSDADLPADSDGDNRLIRCLAIVAKNVPVTGDLLEQLADCQLLGDDAGLLAGRMKSAKDSNRRQPDQQQLFVSMATMGPAPLRQLAACLRTTGHPLMAEFVLQTVSAEAAADSDAGGQRLPDSVAAHLADYPPEAQRQLRQLLTEAQLLAWCRGLFDPAGADVMSLRRQHAEESWRAAKEVREKSAALAELQAQLSASQSALSEREETISRLESRISQLAASAGVDADGSTERRLEVSRRHQVASEAQTQRASSRLESHRAAFDFVRDQIRQFEADGAGHLPTVASSASTAAAAFGGQRPMPEELLDDAQRLEAFRADFGDRFMPLCRAMLEERRQLTRLAESLKGGGEPVDPGQPLAIELARLVAGLADENALLTARHRLLRSVLDGDDSSSVAAVVESEAAADAAAAAAGASTDDELVAAVGSLRRQIAERDRRIAALTTGVDDGDAAGEPTTSPTPQLQRQRRSIAVARAWEEIAPAATSAMQQQLPAAGGSGEVRRRYSVLPDIGGQQQQQQQQRTAGGGQIPHSHRKATKREAKVQKKEPPGKPLSANVVSLS